MKYFPTESFKPKCVLAVVPRDPTDCVADYHACDNCPHKRSVSIQKKE